LSGAGQPRAGRASTALGLGACLLYLALALSTASSYGLSWDQPDEWHVAERSLRYLLSLDESWLELDQPVDLEMGGTHPRLRPGSQAHQTSPFGNLLSSAGCYLFFVKLGWLGPVEAHQLPNHLLMSGLLAAMFFFLRRAFGTPVALLALLCIALQPRLFAHAHINSKNFPFACLMGFTLLAARRGLLRRSPGWIATTGMLLGLATATRLSAGLIPLILIGWYLLGRRFEPTTFAGPTNGGGRAGGRRFLISLAISPLLAGFTFIAVTPAFWASPFSSLVQHWSWFSSRAVSGGSIFPWQTAASFVVAQPFALLLFGAGATLWLGFAALRGRAREAELLLLLWLALPLLRALLPFMRGFDGVRLFLEYAVPLGALTAVGAVHGARWLALRLERLAGDRAAAGRVLASLLVALPFSVWLITMWHIHPQQLVYFNRLVGGASGVERLCGGCGVATDYWGSSYRQGMEWLGREAERGATVVVPLAGELVAATRRMWLRPDLRLIEVVSRSDAPLAQVLEEAGPGPVYFMFVTRRAAYGELCRAAEREGELAHAIRVDGVPILQILRLAGGPAPGP